MLTSEQTVSVEKLQLDISDVESESDLPDSVVQEMAEENQGLGQEFQVTILGRHKRVYPELKTAHNSAKLKVRGGMTVKELKEALADYTNLDSDDMFIENTQELKEHSPTQPLEPDYRTLSSCGIPGNRPNYWEDGTLHLYISPKKEETAKDDHLIQMFGSLSNVEEITPTAVEAMGEMAAPMVNAVKSAKQMRAMGQIEEAQQMELMALTSANQILSAQDVDWTKVHDEYRHQVAISQMQGLEEQLENQARAAKGGDMELEDVMTAMGGEQAAVVRKQRKYEAQAAAGLKEANEALSHTDYHKPHTTQNVDGW